MMFVNIKPDDQTYLRTFIQRHLGQACRKAVNERPTLICCWVRADPSVRHLRPASLPVPFTPSNLSCPLPLGPSTTDASF